MEWRQAAQRSAVWVCVLGVGGRSVVYGDLVTFRLSGTIRRLSVEERLQSHAITHSLHHN